MNIVLDLVAKIASNKDQLVDCYLAQRVENMAENRLPRHVDEWLRFAVSMRTQTCTQPCGWDDYLHADFCLMLNYRWEEQPAHPPLRVQLPHPFDEAVPTVLAVKAAKVDILRST